MKKILSSAPFFTLALGSFLTFSLPFGSAYAGTNDNSAKIQEILKKYHLTPVNPSQIVSKPRIIVNHFKPNPVKPGTKIIPIPKELITLATDDTGNVHSFVSFYNYTNYNETLRPSGALDVSYIDPDIRSQTTTIYANGGSQTVYTIGNNKQIDYEVTATDNVGHGCDYSVDIFHFAQNGVDYYVPTYITTAIQGSDGWQPTCSIGPGDGSDQNASTKTVYYANASAAAYFQ